MLLLAEKRIPGLDLTGCNCVGHWETVLDIDRLLSIKKAEESV